MKIMLLTAGQGTRLRPHTDYLPKPAIPFLNVPLFLYSIKFLSDITISKVVMNTFHLPNRLKEAVRGVALPFPIEFSDEATLLGSGGGLGFAKEKFKNEQNLILMNGDEVIISDHRGQLKKALEFHQTSDNLATLLVMESSEVGRKFGGVWVDEENNILGFGKNSVVKSVKGFHYIGVGIFKKDIFDFIPGGESNILYDNLMKAIASGKKAKVFEFNCKWFETGNEVDFKQATYECLNLIKKNDFYGIYLREVLARFSPGSKIILDSSKNLIYDSSSSFQLQNIFGNCVIGAGVKINSSTQITNSILGDKLQIQQSGAITDKMILLETDAQGINKS